MVRPRYPTPEEFWSRLEERNLEPDLRSTLRERTDRERGRVERLEPPEAVEAVAARVLPGAVPPRALAVFVDQHYDRQLGRADERHGVMPREELIPEGFRLLSEVARAERGAPFAEISDEEQDALLRRAEAGELRGDGRFDSSQWFKRVAQLLMLGYGSDPRGMIEMGFPGPPFEPGHVWLDRAEVRARAERRRGYRTL